MQNRYTIYNNNNNNKKYINLKVKQDHHLQFSHACTRSASKITDSHKIIWQIVIKSAEVKT